MSVRRWFGFGPLAVSALPVVAWAHPGHGAGGGSDSLLHYLTEPLHVVVGLGVLIAGIASLAVLRRERRVRR